MYEYKGYTISKTFKHGYSYWHIEGRKVLFNTLRDAKRYVDKLVEEA